MTTINLYQDKNEKASNGNLHLGFYFSLSILIITVLVVIGLNLFIPNIKKEIVALDESIVFETARIADLKNLENVLDTQKRLSEIKSGLQIENGKVGRLEMGQVLENLGGDLLNSVIVEEYVFNAPGKVSAKLSTNNFDDAAKQILNLKKSNHFLDVNLMDISREEKGISYEVAMQIKK